MIDLMDITDAECSRYINTLIPRLLKKKPAEWTSIESIANDKHRFVEIVECLASYHYFDNKAGFCMIELNNDATCIRVDSNAIRFPRMERYCWKYTTNRK